MDATYPIDEYDRQTALDDVHRWLRSRPRGTWNIICDGFDASDDTASMHFTVSFENARDAWDFAFWRLKSCRGRRS